VITGYVSWSSGDGGASSNNSAVICAESCDNVRARETSSARPPKGSMLKGRVWFDGLLSQKDLQIYGVVQDINTYELKLRDSMRCVMNEFEDAMDFTVVKYR
jgi:hypothetical protein